MVSISQAPAYLLLLLLLLLLLFSITNGS
jgi:hypothetical protein